MNSSSISPVQTSSLWKLKLEVSHFLSCSTVVTYLKLDEINKVPKLLTYIQWKVNPW